MIVQRKAIYAIVCAGMTSLINDVHPRYFTDPVLKNIYQGIIESLMIKRDTNYESVSDTISQGTFNEFEKAKCIAALKAIVSEAHEIGSGIGEQLCSEYRRGVFNKLSEFLADPQNTENQKIEATEKAFKTLTDFHGSSDGDILLDLIASYREKIKSGEEEKLSERSIKLYDHSLQAMMPTGRIWPVPQYIAAREGFGKTLVLINLINDMLSSGKRGIFYSLDLRREMIRNQFISLKCGINFDRVCSGELSEDEMARVDSVTENYKNLIVKSGTWTVDDYHKDANKECLTKNIDFIAVDHIHRFWGLGRSTSEQVGGLQHLSKINCDLSEKYIIPVISLAQVNENKAYDKEKTEVVLSIGDILGSSAFKNDARQVFLIDGPFAGTTKNWKVAKTDFGPKFTKQFEYDGSVKRVTNVFNV